MSFLIFAMLAAAASAQTTDARADRDSGRKAYEARCVSCHGTDGGGGGHGPSIIDLSRPRAATDQALRDLIRKGIPEVGMPPSPLRAAEIDAIVAHLAVLRAPAADHPVAGDVTLGEGFFNGKGACSSCHMVRGRGGVVGPDLSNLARERKLGQIEAALKGPPAPGFGVAGPDSSSSYRSVSVQMRNGQSIRGLVKYDDTFDLGMQGFDGSFHSISKRDVTDVTHEPSLMPKVEATPEEVRNLLAYLTRLTVNQSPAATFTGTAAIGAGTSFANIARPKVGEWPTYHGHLSGNRHSPLNQIDASNVGRLVPRWTFPVPGAARALQVTPVVVDGVMYITAVNEATALDARTGRQIWRYSRPRTKGVIGDAGSGINRGVAVLGDRVFMVTDHAHLIALHRLTGHLLWDVEMADYRQHYGSTSAPLVVNDLVIAGVSGGDEGIRGFLDAYRASTGERAWRFWAIPARGEPGSETWIGKALEHGCGATWLTGTYDPETRLLYWPIGNPCPDYNGDERKGDNLYTNSVVALDPGTGTRRWHYQFTPHDLHDWDATETPMLVDAEFGGRQRKLLVQGNRNGFFYVLDRITGEFLMAEPFVKNLTWATGVGADGRPRLVAGHEPTPTGTRVCPAVAGATNWPSTAFNPDTGLFYLMAAESCNIYTKNSEWWKQGESFYGGGTRRA